MSHTSVSLSYHWQTHFIDLEIGIFQEDETLRKALHWAWKKPFVEETTTML